VLRIPTCLRGIKLEWNHGRQWDGATPEDQCFRDHINKIKICITKCDRLRWGKIPQAIKSSYELNFLHWITFNLIQEDNILNVRIKSLVSANKKGGYFQRLQAISPKFQFLPPCNNKTVGMLFPYVAFAAAASSSFIFLSHLRFWRKNDSSKQLSDASFEACHNTIVIIVHRRFTYSQNTQGYASLR
jgi:hypothetical protein